MGAVAAAVVRDHPFDPDAQTSLCQQPSWELHLATPGEVVFAERGWAGKQREHTQGTGQHEDGAEGYREHRAEIAGAYEVDTAGHFPGAEGEHEYVHATAGSTAPAHPLRAPEHQHGRRDVEGR